MTSNLITGDRAFRIKSDDDMPAWLRFGVVLPLVLTMGALFIVSLHGFFKGLSETRIAFGKKAPSAERSKEPE